MAQSLWGNVYLDGGYAGQLQEEPGGRCVFIYDAAWVAERRPAIAHTLPLRDEPYIDERGLHPFFDNLVAEGWLRNAQARVLDVAPSNGFALLLGFGSDLAGAVTVLDPEQSARRVLDQPDEATSAAMKGSASLSGIQRKLLLIKKGKGFLPVGPGEPSTHIAKLSSGEHQNILALEYLTTMAVRHLLPDDDIVDMEIMFLPSIGEEALVIPRFDRARSGRRLHFEEFNQLLGKYSGDDKYEGAYQDMGHFILNTPGCVPAEADRLLRRILACLLVGNTDAHLKNFAMFHTPNGLRLTPAYDLVAGSYYADYQRIALTVGEAHDLDIGKLQAKHLLSFGEGSFGVAEDAVVLAIEQLGKRLSLALAAIEESEFGSKALRTTLQERMEKRWNGSFASTGQLLSKRQNRDARASG